jgi:hypothetical protein
VLLTAIGEQQPKPFTQPSGDGGTHAAGTYDDGQGQVRTFTGACAGPGHD